MKLKFSLFIIIATTLYSCHLFSGKSGMDADENKESKGLYLIETSYGNMTVKLYDETPLHKANFEKLVDSGFYNGTLFHRIIKGFMIQGGDPNSKGAQPGAQLGTGGPGYTIPAEINDTLLHKKGALAAARQGDQVNPTKASSGSQFYIVQGQKLTDQNIQQIEFNINNSKRQALGYALFNDPKNKEIKDQITYFQTLRNQDSVSFYVQKIEEQINDTFPNVEFKYSPKAIETYKTVGGTAMLDANYTVFGQVIEGLDIIDSLANVATGQADRPLNDVIMNIKKI